MRLTIVIAAVIASSIACVPGFVQEHDPYRIGLLLSEDRSQLSVLYADCGKKVQIHSVMLGERRSQPLWLITSPGSDLREFVVGGETPPGWTQQIRLEQPLANRRYLVSIDSSRLKGESYPFSMDELVPGMVRLTDDVVTTREKFGAAAEC